MVRGFFFGAGSGSPGRKKGTARRTPAARPGQSEGRPAFRQERTRSGERFLRIIATVVVSRMVTRNRSGSVVRQAEYLFRVMVWHAVDVLAGVHLLDGVGRQGPVGFNPVNVGLLVGDGKVTMTDAGPPGVLLRLPASRGSAWLGLAAGGDNPPSRRPCRGPGWRPVDRASRPRRRDVATRIKGANRPGSAPFFSRSGRTAPGPVVFGFS